MNASSDAPEVLSDYPAVKRRRRRSPSPPIPATSQAVGQTSSGEANRRAAAILEVLAGERSPSQAAEALEVSLPYFYLLERKALEGLVRACEVQPKGPPPPSAAEKLALVEQQLAASQRECQRLAALVRVTQRAVGLPSGAAPKQSKTHGAAAGKSSGKPSGKRNRRRPAVRALRAAQTARKNAERSAAKDGSAKNSLQSPPAVVQPAIVENGSALAAASAPPD
jgi:hypothetical protein